MRSRRRPAPGSEQLDRAVKEELRGPHVSGAEDGAGQASQAADHDHREQLDRCVRTEAVERDRAQRHDVEAAGEAGQHAGEREGDEPDAVGADREGGRGAFVVTHGHHRAPGPRAAEAADHDERSAQGGKAEVVPAQRRVELVALEQVGTADARWA